VAVVMSYVSPDEIFYFIINSAGAVALFVYAIICGSQLRMRRALEASAPEKLKLRMWGYPWLSWVTLVLTLVVVTSMLFVDEDTRVQLYLSLLSLAVILAVYALIRRRSPRDATADTRDPKDDTRD
jgi:GABA permease